MQFNQYDLYNKIPNKTLTKMIEYLIDQRLQFRFSDLIKDT